MDSSLDVRLRVAHAVSTYLEPPLIDTDEQSSVGEEHSPPNPVRLLCLCKGRAHLLVCRHRGRAYASEGQHTVHRGTDREAQKVQVLTFAPLPTH